MVASGDWRRDYDDSRIPIVALALFRRVVSKIRTRIALATLVLAAVAVPTGCGDDGAFGYTLWMTNESSRPLLLRLEGQTIAVGSEYLDLRGKVVLVPAGAMHAATPFVVTETVVDEGGQYRGPQSHVEVMTVDCELVGSFMVGSGTFEVGVAVDNEITVRPPSGGEPAVGELDVLDGRCLATANP